VNKTHYYHHQNVYTNFGPEYCDILFGTKNPEDEIEDQSHMVPNAIILTSIVLLLKYLYKRYTTIN
jgi:hypothetical protein